MKEPPNSDDPKYKDSVGGFKFYLDALQWKIEEIDERLDKIEKKLED